VWSRFRVNYKYMLCLGAGAPGAIGVAEAAVRASLAFLALFIVYVKVRRGELPAWIPAGYYTLIVFLGLIAGLVIPWRQRGGIWRGIAKIVTLPWGEVTLLTSVIADVLTSHIHTLKDVAYAVGFFTTGAFLHSDTDAVRNAPRFTTRTGYQSVVLPLLTVLPLLWRMLQNLKQYLKTQRRFPFVVNAGKYALNHVVVLFGVFHGDLFQLRRDGGGKLEWASVVFVALFVTATMYSFVWDVAVDWGLGRRTHGFLRKRLMYRVRWPYFAAIAVDLALRFVWTLTLVPINAQDGSQANLAQLPWLKNAVGPIEIVRRSMWLMLRLECEHLHNTFRFRDLNHVPLLFETPTVRPVEEDSAKSLSAKAGRTKYVVLAECAAFIVVVTGLAVLAAERKKL
jgi:hypothetical protein